MTRREPGHGTIEELPSGRFRAKVWLADGRRHGAGTHDTREEAEGMIAALVVESQSTEAQVLTVRHLVRRFEEHLERSRSYAAMPNVRSIRKRWIEPAELAEEPARSVDSGMIGEWLTTLAVSERYAKQALTLVRRAYAWGVGKGLVDSNPARDIQVERRPVPVHEPWTFLDPAEQAAFFTCPTIPNDWRPAIQFAAGSGLRAGEQWALRLSDLVVDGPEPHAVVRYGSRRRAPKGRKIRLVPLIGLALAAAREQLTMLARPGVKNPHGLVFPSVDGGFRKVSRCPDWNYWLRAAGIRRRVRWHDLRHTCGASLVSGWWGRRWTLEEVRDLLGHHSVRMTERYAHLGASAVKIAAASTTGPRGVHAVTERHGIVREGIDPRHPPQVAETPGEAGVRGLWRESTATALLETAARGEECGALVAELAEGTSKLAAELTGPFALEHALELAALLRAFAGAWAESSKNRKGTNHA